MYELKSGNPKAVEEANRVLAAMLEGADEVIIGDVNFRDVKKLEVVDTAEEREAHTLFIHLANGGYADVEIGFPWQTLKAKVLYSEVSVLSMTVWDNGGAEDV